MAAKPAKKPTRRTPKRKAPRPPALVAPPLALGPELRDAVEAAAREEARRQVTRGGAAHFDGDALARVAADAFARECALLLAGRPPLSLPDVLAQLGAVAKGLEAFELPELAFAANAFLRATKNTIFAKKPVPPALTAWAESMFPANPFRKRGGPKS